MSEYHVVPVEDLVAHEEDEDCVCGPDSHLEAGSVIYVHQALDGRE